MVAMLSVRPIIGVRVLPENISQTGVQDVFENQSIQPKDRVYYDCD